MYKSRYAKQHPKSIVVSYRESSPDFITNLPECHSIKLTEVCFKYKFFIVLLSFLEFDLSIKARLYRDHFVKIFFLNIFWNFSYTYKNLKH